MKQKNACTGGYAMVLVICVTALVVALCLSLLVTTGAVYSRARRENSCEQCRILTVSLSKQLESQLLDPDYNAFADEAAEAAADDGTLWFVVKKSIQGGAWPYFNENESGHTAQYAYKTYTFQDGAPAQFAGVEHIEIVMYWASENGAALTGTSLYIDVTCQMNGQSCTVQSEFLLDAGEPGQGASEAYQPWSWRLNWRE